MPVQERYIESDRHFADERDIFTSIHLLTRENRFRKVRSRHLQVTRNDEENLLIFYFMKI